MSINEKELFLFVFYPDKLSRENFEYINNNKKVFNEELGLLNSLKIMENESVSDIILQKIYHKIKEKQNRNLIELNKDLNSNDDLSRLVLAADSPTLDRVSQTETFRDKDSHYLIKVISNNDSNKLFIFNDENAELRDFTITIKPSGNTYKIDSSTEPLLIQPKEIIEKISLETD